MNLPEFLLARVAEDEAIAADMARVVPEVGLTEGQTTPFQPARVLAECEAKRRIVALRDRLANPKIGIFGPSKGDQATAALLVDVLSLLALPYADHPDFDPSWRVSA